MLLGRALAGVEQRPGGADIDAFAAVGAGLHLAPGLIQPGDDPAVGAAFGHIPDMGGLDLVADAHAAAAEDAAVVISENRGWEASSRRCGQR